MKYALILVVIIIVGVAGWFYFRGSGNPYASPTPTMTPTPTPTPSVARTSTPSPTPGIIVNEAKSYTVTIQNFSFNPSSVTVKKGDIITFKNMDPTQHTVTSYTAGAFDSGYIDPGTQWTLQTANMAPGTYTYHCNIHLTMHGTIIIQ